MWTSVLEPITYHIYRVSPWYMVRPSCGCHHNIWSGLGVTVTIVCDCVGFGSSSYCRYLLWSTYLPIIYVTTNHKLAVYDHISSISTPWTSMVRGCLGSNCVSIGRLHICWYWVFVHSYCVVWCICSDYFSCFLSRLIRWFVAFMLHCFPLFALFV